MSYNALSVRTTSTIAPIKQHFCISNKLSNFDSWHCTPRVFERDFGSGRYGISSGTTSKSFQILTAVTACHVFCKEIWILVDFWQLSLYATRYKKILIIYWPMNDRKILFLKNFGKTQNLTAVTVIISLFLSHQDTRYRQVKKLNIFSYFDSCHCITRVLQRNLDCGHFW